MPRDKPRTNKIPPKIPLRRAPIKPQGMAERKCLGRLHFKSYSGDVWYRPIFNKRERSD